MLLIKLPVVQLRVRLKVTDNIYLSLIIQLSLQILSLGTINKIFKNRLVLKLNGFLFAFFILMLCFSVKRSRYALSAIMKMRFIKHADISG